jgi:hypothetical protein
MFIMKQIIFIFLILFSLESYSSASSHTLTYSIARAKHYLECNLNQSSLSLPCQSSNSILPCTVNRAGASPFVIYFTVAALMPEMPLEEKDQMLKLLKKDETNGLFSYSKGFPFDTDDFAFAGQTEILFNEKVNLDGLYPFYKPKLNAYSTFLSKRPIVPFTTTLSDYNNYGIHPEVSANLYSLFYKLHQPNKINLKVMKDFQNKNGYWPAYFYSGQYYSTYMNMRVLCALEPHSHAVNNGIQFLLHTQNEDNSWGKPGNSFDTALAILTLVDCHHKGPQAKKGTEYLIKHQYPSGYWSFQKPLWIFIRSENPPATWFAYDDNHIVTTGVATMALRKFIENSPQSDTID